MKTKLMVFLGLTAGFLMFSSSIFAHHSNAISDKDRLVTMTGTVTKFAFINPHVGISFDTKDERGNVVNWYTAGGSPMALHRDAGWTNKTIKLGEQILVQGHPNRDGRPLLLTMRLYRCTGEMIPLDNNKIEAGEYLTHVKMVPLDPAKVQAVCAGKDKVPDQFSDLVKNKK
jgi:Family of unknown function (DUF6152)